MQQSLVAHRESRRSLDRTTKSCTPRVCVCVPERYPEQKSVLWDLAWWIVCSPSMHETLGSVPSTWEIKANRSQGQPGLHEALSQKRKKKKVKYHLYRLMRPPRIPTDKAPQTPAIYSLHWVLKTPPSIEACSPAPHKTPLSKTPKHQHSPCPNSCK